MKWNLLAILVLVLLVVSGCTPKPPTPLPSETPAPIVPATGEQVVTEEEEKAVLPEEEVVTEEEEKAVLPEEEVVTEEEEKATPTPSPVVTPEAYIPIIDAHSQVCPENLDKVIQLMNQAGVTCTILSAGMTSAKGIVTPEELVSLASNNPGRIIPAVRTKISMNTGENYYNLLEKQMSMSQYSAMAEVLVYHGLVKVHLSDKDVQMALKYALDKKWPFIAHIEFMSAGAQREQYMTELEAMLAQYPEHPFVLIHMGQLDHVAARKLIETHNNIYFIISNSSPTFANDARSSWTNMFDGRNLTADWKQLIIDHPDRFIMGFDMVFPENWGQFYLREVSFWREAIKELPVEVAHSLAHGNAERLWHLPPQASAP